MKYFLQFMKHMQCDPLSHRTKSLLVFFLFGFLLVVIHYIIKEEIVLPSRLMNSHV